MYNPTGPASPIPQDRPPWNAGDLALCQQENQPLPAPHNPEVRGEAVIARLGHRPDPQWLGWHSTAGAAGSGGYGRVDGAVGGRSQGELG